MFRCNQSGFVGACREAGPVGGCTKPLGPFGGSRVDSKPLGPVGSAGEGSRILISVFVSVTLPSSLTIPFVGGCESFEITVSGTDSAFISERVGLPLRLRLWCRGLELCSRLSFGVLERLRERSFAAGISSFRLFLSGVNNCREDLRPGLPLRLRLNRRRFSGVSFRS